MIQDKKLMKKLIQEKRIIKMIQKNQEINK